LVLRFEWLTLCRPRPFAVSVRIAVTCESFLRIKRSRLKIQDLAEDMPVKVATTADTARRCC